MRIWFGFIFMAIISFGHAQEENILRTPYYRDAQLKPQWIELTPFMPKLDLKLNLQKDSSVKTSPISNIGRTKAFFQKHFMENYLFEVHEESVNLFVSPVVNFQLGKNLVGEDEPYLFQNSRGF
ncbi:MAG: hypothetical protein ISP70_03225, partial [Crocinitomicaceae bacterium]|nr:hypothetical protein [Crocinitomicaceae bacterium]